MVEGRGKKGWQRDSGALPKDGWFCPGLTGRREAPVSFPPTAIKRTICDKEAL